ncbi:MAG: DUF2269 family protein [Deltaproteobacteria bacterium]|nr:DUF2269 family protein [Deltaproteobacteria bacterium]
MQWLRFLHVLFIVVWLGTATGELVLEVVLWRTASAARQRAYIDLHRIIDLVLEGPALLLSVITGILLLWRGGYLDDTHKWPSWFEDKLICATCVVVANLVCIGFVLLRAKNADNVPGNTAPLSQPGVQRWHYAVTSTFIGVPFALMALWLVVNKG